MTQEELNELASDCRLAFGHQAGAYNDGVDAMLRAVSIAQAQVAAPKSAIDEAVNRFLGWKLPKDFSPDCHIKFDSDSDYFKQYPQEWPTGTNLFTADQARAMFEHCLPALNTAIAAARVQALEEAAKVCDMAVNSIWDYHEDNRKQIGTTVCNNLAAGIRALIETNLTTGENK